MEQTRAMRLCVRSPLLIAVLTLSAIALVTPPVRAQAPVGAIAGVVTDTSGAVLTGASVTATSLSTGGERATTANAQGYFVIPSLKPGEG